jgi:hypothetical protein
MPKVSPTFATLSAAGSRGGGGVATAQAVTANATSTLAPTRPARSIRSGAMCELTCQMKFFMNAPIAP